MNDIIIVHKWLPIQKYKIDVISIGVILRHWAVYYIQKIVYKLKKLKNCTLLNFDLDTSYIENF